MQLRQEIAVLKSEIDENRAYMKQMDDSDDVSDDDGTVVAAALPDALWQSDKSNSSSQKRTSISGGRITVKYPKHQRLVPKKCQWASLMCGHSSR